MNEVPLSVGELPFVLAIIKGLGGCLTDNGDYSPNKTEKNA